MKGLSVVITAFNEEKNIGECLKSIQAIADEIIVVDNSSSDKTVDIAKKHGAKIYTQQNDPSRIDIQKNFGFEKATGEWILSLDADERIPSGLADEIKSEIENSKPETMGYWVPRKNIIFGKWIQHTGWYPDYQLRVFRRGQGKFDAEKVHEPLIVDGVTLKLSSPIHHENYRSINQFLLRMVVYTDSEAKALVAKKYKPVPIDVLRMPLQEFLRRFFTQEGYKDGFHGLILSLLMAFYHLVIFLKVWEAHKFAEQDVNALELFKKESKKMRNELLFWIINAEKQETHNPIKKIWLKTSGKIVSSKIRSSEK